jgi:hypothetical protein
MTQVQQPVSYTVTNLQETRATAAHCNKMLLLHVRHDCKRVIMQA